MYYARKSLPQLRQNWRENGWNFPYIRHSYEIRIIREAIFALFYNISRPILVIWLIWRCFFELWWKTSFVFLKSKIYILYCKLLIVCSQTHLDSILECGKSHVNRQCIVWKQCSNEVMANRKHSVQWGHSRRKSKYRDWLMTEWFPWKCRACAHSRRRFKTAKLEFIVCAND